jgi:hypothetical protein
MSTDNGDAVFDECVADIERAYNDLGHTLGWRFIGVSKGVLRAPVRIALIGLHPGGDYEPPEHPRASCESGNWFMTESWINETPGDRKLQRQVRLMFERIAEEVDYSGNSDDLINESLVSNFIPFRSPSFRLLPRKAESLRFARRFWSKLLPIIRPELIVCLDTCTREALTALVPKCLGHQSLRVSKMPIGWGNYKASLHDFGDDVTRMRLLYLPHPSRYAIFGRQKSAMEVKAIFDAACDHL